MPTIGYHASHEQFRPGDLLTYVRQAEAAGFTGAMCSDHFHPWSSRQGQSGFAWSWLGAALQATGLPFGVVNAPGYRYHPAIIAQAAATLADMYPGRFWLAIGSGEALNERITGDRWPSKAERNQRLREIADVLRALWNGETVSHDGTFRVEEARLYTLPDMPPLIVGAAVTAKTAKWMGSWADALITVSKPPKALKAVVDAFRGNGGEHKPIYVQAKVSYAATEAAARKGAHEEWRTNIFDSSMLADLRSPAEFEAAARFVKPADMNDHVRISADLSQHAEWIQQDLELGADHVYLHNVNREQERFIDAFGERVLPQLLVTS